MLLIFATVFMMDKLSNEEKMHIQTLHEQEFGAKAIRTSYPDKNWSLSMLQMICRRVDETGSAVRCHAGSGRIVFYWLTLYYNQQRCKNMYVIFR